MLQTGLLSDTVQGVMPRKKIEKVLFTARITPAEFQALETTAAREETSMTDVFRRLLKGLPDYVAPPLKKVAVRDRPPTRGTKGKSKK